MHNELTDVVEELEEEIRSLKEDNAALKGMVSHLQAYIISIESNTKSPSSIFSSPVKAGETQRTIRNDLMKLFVGYGTSTESSDYFANGDVRRVNSPLQK
jgi:hypothetical protein